MSSLSEHEQDIPNPNDPSYYAPRWLREKPEQRSSDSRETRSEPAGGPILLPASLDTQLEKAVSNALWHPLDPEVIHEPPGLARELDRRAALFSVAGRFAAAIGVSAIVALFFVIMVPASQQPDGSSSPSAILRSLKAALLQPAPQDEGSKPAIAEFQNILASAQTSPAATQTSPAATRAESEQLLQQFLQWQQKPNQTETSQ
jgi:hypothetical protein